MKREPPQLYLAIEAGPSAHGRLTAVLGAVNNVAAVLIRPGAVALDAASAHPLVELAQKKNIAVLVEGDPSLARALRADGVHLPWSPSLRARFDEAREILGNRFMAGVEIAPDAETARHDAMELAEAGADYVGFGPDAGDQSQIEFLAWWAEIFQVPCVAFGVNDPQRAAAIASTAAEFVCAAIPAAASPADCAARIVQIAAATAERASAV
jgi:thiamine-phosphate pyrophosphorylase